MKNVMVTLLAKKPCELSRFLNSYFNTQIISDECSFKWSCFFERPVDTINLLSTLADNKEEFNIDAIVSISKDSIIHITNENIDELIKVFLWI